MIIDYKKNIGESMLNVVDRFKEEYVPPDSPTNPTGSANEAVINYIENILLKNPTTLKSPTGGYYLDTGLINSQISFATEFYKYCQYQFQQKLIQIL